MKTLITSSSDFKFNSENNQNNFNSLNKKFRNNANRVNNHNNSSANISRSINKFSSTEIMEY